MCTIVSHHIIHSSIPEVFANQTDDSGVCCYKRDQIQTKQEWNKNKTHTHSVSHLLTHREARAVKHTHNRRRDEDGSLLL